MHYQQHPLSSPRTAQVFLDQKKVWVDRNLEVIKIKEMEADYLLATMTFLLKRAEDVKFSQEMYFAALADGPSGPSGDMANDAVDSELDQFAALDARKWMKSTVLFQQMMKRYKKLAQFASPKIQTPLLEVMGDRDF